MKSLLLRIDDILYSQIDNLAYCTGKSKKEIVLEALEAFEVKEKALKAKGSYFGPQ